MFNKNILSTNRVILRYIQPTDLEQLIKIGADPRIWKFQSKYKTSSIEGFKDYFDDAIKQHEKKNQIVWVTTGPDHKYYGMCRFYNIDEFNKSLGIGYSWLGYDFQRTGINKHVKFLQLSYAFEVGGIERVQFSIDELNKQSRDAVQKIGGKFEGYLRNDRTVLDAAFDFNQTRRRTTAVYSIIKPDWEETKKLILSQL